MLFYWNGDNSKCQVVTTVTTPLMHDLSLERLFYRHRDTEASTPILNLVPPVFLPHSCMYTTITKLRRTLHYITPPLNHFVFLGIASLSWLNYARSRKAFWKCGTTHLLALKDPPATVSISITQRGETRPTIPRFYICDNWLSFFLFFILFTAPLDIANRATILRTAFNVSATIESLPNMAGGWVHPLPSKEALPPGPISTLQQHN